MTQKQTVQTLLDRRTAAGKTLSGLNKAPKFQTDWKK